MEAETLEHGAGFVADPDLGGVDGALLGHEVESALAFLLLQLEGDAADGALFEALHEMGGEASNLVAETLGRNRGDIVDDALVDLEVVGHAEG